MNNIVPPECWMFENWRKTKLQTWINPLINPALPHQSYLRNKTLKRILQDIKCLFNLSLRNTVMTVRIMRFEIHSSFESFLRW